MRTLSVVAVMLGALAANSWQLAAQSGPPEELKWDAKLKADVGEAMRHVAQDPVNSLYVFRDLEMRQEKPKPNSRQKAWLAEYRRSIEPTALESVQRQFDEAARQLDIRTLMILDVVAHEVLPDRLNRAESFEAVRKRVLHETVPSSIFRVEAVSAIRLDGAYREGGANNRTCSHRRPVSKLPASRAM